MTNSPTITQADREAVAEHARNKWSGEDIYTSFARHREQAVADKDARIADLEAENARMREALVILRDLHIVENDKPDTLWIDGEPHRGPAVDFLFKMARRIKEVARQALEGRSDG